MGETLPLKEQQPRPLGLMILASWAACLLLVVYGAISARPMEGVLGATFIVGGAALALPSIWKAGLYSLGSVSLVIALFPFLLKWLANSRPASPRILAYDNDQAIWISGIFFGFFFVAYRARFKTHDASTHRMRAGSVPSGALLLFGIIGFLAVAIRQWLASEFAIGVPGVVPHAPTGFGSLFGVLYYVGAYLPLGIALVLFVGRQAGRLAPALAGSAMLFAHALIGIDVGSRGAVAFAVGILLLGAAWGPRRVGRRPVGAIIVAAIVGIFAMRFGIDEALESRESSLDSGNNAFQFLLGRIGGLDYVSPVVSVLEGRSWAYLSPSAWNSFLNQQVYHLPAGVTNGSASSLPGWVFGFGGILGLLAAGLLCGAICGQLDSRIAFRVDVVDKLRQAGLLLLWSILLLEGNVVGAVYAGAALLALAAAMSITLSGEPEDKPKQSRA